MSFRHFCGTPLHEAASAQSKSETKPVVSQGPVSVRSAGKGSEVPGLPCGNNLGFQGSHRIFWGPQEETSNSAKYSVAPPKDADDIMPPVMTQVFTSDAVELSP